MSARDTYDQVARLQIVEDGEAETAPESALVARALEGDVDAWSRLYEAHFDGLYRHLRYLSGDPSATEELVQETFALAFSAVSKFRGDAGFVTWLHGIGINVVRTHWRRAKKRGVLATRLRMLTEALAEQAEPPDRGTLRRQRAAALYSALERLPDHLREAFVLRELEGLSPQEAAAQLGITPNNVNVRAARARTKLRKLLEALERRGER